MRNPCWIISILYCNFCPRVYLLRSVLIQPLEIILIPMLLAFESCRNKEKTRFLKRLTTLVMSQKVDPLSSLNY